MPTKKKKFNARFPPARIKKIMQTDEDVGKVAAAVPVIISKALEIFMQTLVEKACNYTQARNAKTLSTAHLKRCITSEQQFDFLKDLVENIPDLPANEEEGEGEPKPKRRKAQPSAPKEKQTKSRKRDKKKDKSALTDESDEEVDSEEEESVSSEGHSYHGNSTSTSNTSNANIPAITISKPENEQDEVFEPPAAASLSMPSSFASKPLLNTCPSIEEDDDYDS